MVNIFEEAMYRARNIKNKIFGSRQGLSLGGYDLISLAKLPRKTAQRVMDNVFGGTVIVENPVVKKVRQIELLPSGAGRGSGTMAPASKRMEEMPPSDSTASRIIKIQTI